MKKYLFILFIIIISSISAAQERTKIVALLNREIFIADGFSGQSITLIKENKNYFIIRKFFGSGLPVISILKYQVEFKSDYQLKFSKVIEGKSSFMKKNKSEEFVLIIDVNDKIILLLNGIQVVVDPATK